ncbi:MAG: peptidoglycan-binding protein [Devosiaceae bacterium]
MMDEFQADGAPYVYRRPARGQAAIAPDAYDEFDDGYGDDFGDEPHTLIDRILAAPGKLAVTVVALVAFGLVGVNAAYMQPGAHPSPMLSTRGDAPASALPQLAVAPTQRGVTLAPAPIVPPSRAYDATASIPARGDQIASLVAGETVGPRFGAPAPTPRPQFAGIATAVATVAPTPVPVASVPVAPVAAAPRTVQTIAITDPIGALLAPVITPNPTVGTNQPLPRAAETRSAQPVVAAVQAVLAEMGYQPGSIDGVIGPSTEEAIRRFQLRRALEPNGQITGDLLREIERVTGTRISAT